MSVLDEQVERWSAELGNVLWAQAAGTATPAAVDRRATLERSITELGGIVDHAALLEAACGAAEQNLADRRVLLRVAAGRNSPDFDPVAAGRVLDDYERHCQTARTNGVQ